MAGGSCGLLVSSAAQTAAPLFFGAVVDAAQKSMGKTTFHINGMIYLCTLYDVYENVELLNMHVEIQYFGVVFSLLNTIINLHIADELTSTVLTLLVIYIVYAIFAVIRAWLFTLAGQRLVARLRKHLFNHIIQQDVAFFDTNR